MTVWVGPIEPLGSGSVVDETGQAVIVDLTPLDCLIVARLQDVEDHPDRLLDEAA